MKLKGKVWDAMRESKYVALSDILASVVEVANESGGDYSKQVMLISPFNDVLKVDANEVGFVSYDELDGAASEVIAFINRVIRDEVSAYDAVVQDSRKFKVSVVAHDMIYVDCLTDGSSYHIECDYVTDMNDLFDMISGKDPSFNKAEVVVKNIDVDAALNVTDYEFDFVYGGEVLCISDAAIIEDIVDRLMSRVPDDNQGIALEHINECAMLVTDTRNDIEWTLHHKPGNDEAELSNTLIKAEIRLDSDRAVWWMEKVFGRQSAPDAITHHIDQVMHDATKDALDVVAQRIKSESIVVDLHRVVITQRGSIQLHSKAGDFEFVVELSATYGNDEVLLRKGNVFIGADVTASWFAKSVLGELWKVSTLQRLFREVSEMYTMMEREESLNVKLTPLKFVKIDDKLVLKYIIAGRDFIVDIKGTELKLIEGTTVIELQDADRLIEEMKHHIAIRADEQYRHGTSGEVIIDIDTGLLVQEVDSFGTKRTQQYQMARVVDSSVDSCIGSTYLELICNQYEPEYWVFSSDSEILAVHEDKIEAGKLIKQQCIENIHYMEYDQRLSELYGKGNTAIKTECGSQRIVRIEVEGSETGYTYQVGDKIVGSSYPEKNKVAASKFALIDVLDGLS